MGTYLELNYLKDLQGEFSYIEYDGEQLEPHIYVAAGELLPLMRLLS